MGYDAIALKSGWDEYGIAFGKPTKNLHIRHVHLRSSSGAAVAFGSEMSGGISYVVVEQVHVYNSRTGIEFRTTKGRGGNMKDVFISDLEMENLLVAFSAEGHCGSHPDDRFDPNAIPFLGQITFRDVAGINISTARSFDGIEESPFTNICLSNVTLSTTSSRTNSWTCSNVSGFSDSVFPEPCSDLGHTLNSSLSCFSLLSNSINGNAAAM